MDYNGWTLYDEIILVIKDEKYRYGKYEYPQAYVVNNKDKKQLNSALNWGRVKQYQYDESGKPIKDEKGYTQYIILEPKQVVLKNEGFTVELLDSAGSSTQGGKLSFWNCLISHEDIKCVVGINADILLDALLQNTFINGKCKNTFSFARKSGNVGILSNNMKEYQQAIEDMQAKKNIGKGKTTKWQIGRNYKTLTYNDTYLGKVYKPLKVKSESNYVNYNYNYEIVVSEESNSIKHLCIHTGHLNDVKTYKDFLMYLRKKIKKYLDVNGTRESVIYELYNFDYLTKLPSRQQGDFDLNVPDTFADDLDTYFNNIKTLVVELLESDSTFKIYPYNLSDLIVSTKPLTCDSLTELDKKLIKLVLSERNISKCFGTEGNHKVNYKINI